jgi:hypothetical protein
MLERIIKIKFDQSVKRDQIVEALKKVNKKHPEFKKLKAKVSKNEYILIDENAKYITSCEYNFSEELGVLWIYNPEYEKKDLETLLSFYLVKLVKTPSKMLTKIAENFIYYDLKNFYTIYQGSYYKLDDNFKDFTKISPVVISNAVKEILEKNEF